MSQDDLLILINFSIAAFSKSAEWSFATADEAIAIAVNF